MEPGRRRSSRSSMDSSSRSAEQCGSTGRKSRACRRTRGRALMAEPSLLVLDEPSLGLAPKLVTEIFETIRTLRESGLTVLMVEQNAYQALRIADFGYVVQDGRIVNEGPPDKLLDMEELRKAYFGIP